MKTTKDIICVFALLVLLAALFGGDKIQHYAVKIMVVGITILGFMILVWIPAYFASAFTDVRHHNYGTGIHPGMFAASFVVVSTLFLVYFLGWWLLYIGIGVVVLSVAGYTFYRWRQRKRLQTQI